MNIDPEMFGQAIGEAIRKAVEPLQKRIDFLERELQKSRPREQQSEKAMRDRLCEIAMSIVNEQGLDRGQSLALARSIVSHPNFQLLIRHELAQLDGGAS